MGKLTEPMHGIDKEAGVPWKTVGKLGLGGLFLGMGVDYAGSIGKKIGDAANKSPVGSQSQQQWQADVNRAYKKRATTTADIQAQRRIKRGGAIGLGSGLLTGVAAGVITRNPLLGLGMGLLGRQAGLTLSKKFNPRGTARLSHIDTVMNQYASLFSPGDRAKLLQIRNSSAVMKDPQKQQQIASMIQQVASKHPDAKKAVKRGSKWGTAAKILGGAGFLAMMLKGKGALAGKGLAARLGGNTMPMWGGLAAAGMGAGIYNTHAAGRRTNLTQSERKKNVVDSATGMDAALNAMFYGGMVRPKGWR